MMEPRFVVAVLRGSCSNVRLPVGVEFEVMRYSKVVFVRSAPNGNMGSALEGSAAIESV